MREEDIQIIREIIQEELANLIGIDRYLFQKHIQIFDARNIQLGKTNGTKIGTEGATTAKPTIGQKIGFYGTTPTLRPTAVAVSSAGIHAALVNLGLITA